MLRKLVVALSVAALGAAACTHETGDGKASQPVPAPKIPKVRVLAPRLEKPPWAKKVA